MPRRAKTLKERILGFLADYQDSCSITEAAKRNGISRQRHYKWLQTKPKYAELFRETQAIAAEYLESEAVRRATKGWSEPIYYQGAQCGTVRRYDGGLMQFLLRGMLPEKYGSKTEISGPQGQPIQAKIEVIFVKPLQLSSPISVAKPNDRSDGPGEPGQLS